LGKKREPFIFILDFDKQNYIIDSIDTKDILYDFDGIKNYTPKDSAISLKKYPISLQEYTKGFDIVQSHIQAGNSYLLNLTSSTKIDIDKELKDIFLATNAKFKIYAKDSDRVEFICSSPERFIKIKNNNIYTYPMKGTIDASIKDAKDKILSDKKELAEHTMVVDLLRNDLGSIATNIKVDDFRYIDKIKTNESEILQVSSQISASLEDGWQDRVGDILDTITPAGSISGTPKKKSIEVIHQAETHKRGFFTGICVYFDGNMLDSGVMIRYIESRDDGIYYKSGGGITSDSELSSEYQEMIDKVYIAK
jgi:para-aminobenzoate synthetase component 1